jgi:dolichol-phosphate mannosyltransferase
MTQESPGRPPRSEPSPVTVVVPTFNESATIERVVAAVRATGFRILVVDDASPDGTGAIADLLAARDPGVAVLHRRQKAGLGPAYAAGFAEAIGAGADILCQMDADLQHDPAALPTLVAALDGGADLVIGSRLVAGGRIEGWPLWRRLMSRWGNRYARFALGVPVRDLTSGFRAIGRDAVDLVDPASWRSHGYAFLVEMTLRAHRRGLRIVEVPITFRDRAAGVSKLDGRVALESMWLVTIWGLGRLVGKGPARQGTGS